uniref:Membrane associated ring-CH-type finger 2 n=1 Tax=Rhinolophus ferrumequinum TaxID=59479 RepID=A0A671F2I2_RHIFE
SAGERRSPLALDSVCSAGGVRTQVPAGAELAALTGPAGPGPGPGRTEGPERPPGPAADQGGSEGHVGLGTLLAELFRGHRSIGRLSWCKRLLGPWASGPEDQVLPVAMTTGDCCHLPGSLCDCSGSPAFSKVVEATGLRPPQYVAQVTSRDGRLLSTVIRALDTPRSPSATIASCILSGGGPTRKCA